MSNEIEEFLRRAAQRRAAQQAAKAAPAKATPTQAPPRQSTPFAEPVVDAVEIVDAVSSPTGAGITEHVNRHLSSNQFAERASHLGELAGQADDSMQAHLHKTFDHSIGQIAGKTTSLTADLPDDSEKSTTPPGSSTMAEELLNFFRSPASMRAAIVLNEIIGRKW